MFLRESDENLVVPWFANQPSLPTRIAKVVEKLWFFFFFHLFGIPRANEEYQVIGHPVRAFEILRIGSGLWWHFFQYQALGVNLTDVFQAKFHDVCDDSTATRFGNRSCRKLIRGSVNVVD